MLQAVIKAMPSDPTAAAADITAMGEVNDPSLPDSTLGALLATLSADANAGNYQTVTLPVEPNGALGPGPAPWSPSSSAAAWAAPRTAPPPPGSRWSTPPARASGLAGRGHCHQQRLHAGARQRDRCHRSASTITYTSDARANDAQQLAEDLGLPRAP
ncbi:hypothetical protein GXW82_25340 [Streptacidiphilus sp. 4-A2]|nr:hypothetical protein [Streptacidiphilus sp. 4-A2]